ncbi:Spermatogenesis-associated protein 13 [Bagarius yarrelli]|uniref:Spermatogenesis-associated protein 13 n=1 Tax=Bagarius yarrelli TaxID=175774 RepID=A0A556TWL5_BAGYA|nr:Spermatogenesis-associated protein 13 [Bagarius yarrelli]
MSLAYPSNANGVSLDSHTRSPVRFSCSSFEAEKQANLGAPVRPVYPEVSCEKRGLNGMSAHQWPTPIIVDAQDISCPSKNGRIFSFHRKCGMAGPERTPLRGPVSASQARPGLHFMGSFKKLRSSVLQGIQNRGGATADNQEKDLTSEESNGFFVTKRNFENRQTNGKGLPVVRNGLSTTAASTGVLHMEDDEDEDGYGLQRNSHFSRSIRRAYGAGRIPLLDNGGKQSEHLTAQEPALRSRPCSTVEPMEPNVIFNTDIKALNRLSKSADNLHIFKSPFKRKVPPTQSQNPDDLSTQNFKRSSSTSSVIVQECVSGRCKGVTGVRGKMLKLVGSLTDLSTNRKPIPDPTPTASLSSLSQLHDDYSRRTPCVSASERQRRPPPSNTCSSDKQKIQADVHNHTSASHVDSVVPTSSDSSNHQVPEVCTAAEQSDQLPLRLPALCLEQCVTGEEKKNEEIGVHLDKHCTSPGQEQRWGSVQVNLETPSGASSYTDLTKENAERFSDSVFVSPPVTPTCASASPTSPASSCDTPVSSVPRRRANKKKPRPLSDYGQLICRKYTIPKEDVELQSDALEERDSNNMHTELQSLEKENGCVNGHVDSRRKRPISLIGGVDLFKSPGEKEDADLPSPVARPPVPSHRVPPYRAVSARLRPYVFSQSTPTGLDRVGRRKTHRVLSGHAVYAEALWDHVTMGEQELAFKAGDVIRVLDAQEKDWWWGLVGERQAWFPSSFVRVRVNQEDSSSDGVENSPEQQEALSKEPHNQNAEHREQMRANVVQEIMNTERVYIKHLRDICEFQRKFLKDLEKNYDKVNPHLSEIGSCFLQQGEGFSIYSEYCNTHPAACAELQRLMKQGRYKHFFEACRLLQQMIDISIAGFLLTPNVASLINERKRRLESIDTIAHWQEAIMHWEGEDVLSRSSELIYSGELTRVVRAGKTQQRSGFLFDHQLVFCKKDVLWRDLLHYRGRLNTDCLVPMDLPDGRHPDLGTLRNAVALRNRDTLEVLCVLSCRKAQDKQLWLEAFSRERRRVKEDQEMDIKYAGHPVAHHHQPLHPIHQRHVTVPTSIPQQQVFSLAEPKRKPAHLWYTFTRNALFRK